MRKSIHQPQQMLTHPIVLNSVHSTYPIPFASAENVHSNWTPHHSICNSPLCPYNCCEPIGHTTKSYCWYRIDSSPWCHIHEPYGTIHHENMQSLLTPLPMWNRDQRPTNWQEKSFYLLVFLLVSNIQWPIISLNSIKKWIVWNIYLSDTAWTRSIFFDSQMTMAGKCVSQSRYDVSTTKLIALCWNASMAELISNADATQDIIMQANQNSLSMIWLFGSTTNLMPCKDEFSKYSRNMSLHLGGAILIADFKNSWNGNNCFQRKIFNLYRKCLQFRLVWVSLAVSELCIIALILHWILLRFRLIKVICRSFYGHLPFFSR